MRIHDLILEKLEGEETARGIRLLYACESGSRAWGFASPDSDYDVRTIYSHTADAYLSLREEPDNFLSLDDASKIDLAGWELRKALRLFKGCNASMNEWLLSPIAYRQEDAFLSRMRELLPAYFEPRKAMLHYLGLARQIIHHHLEGDRISIKKAFYVIRPLAAAAWIRDLGGQPPTDFAVILRETPSREVIAIRGLVEDLMAQKTHALEKAPIVLPHELASFFGESLPALEAAARTLAPRECWGIGPLDEVFREHLKR
ncbi:MAG: nucleotidyltransferase domain-containing protein [Candidatus Sumerlaeia bacterium]|nr:nucleotidyltransferase domain-containing protein [Candidatus Sumerlaeia bacterium]